jgi:hypothetical protein
MNFDHIEGTRIRDKIEDINKAMLQVERKIAPLRQELLRLGRMKVFLFPVKAGDLISWKSGKRVMRGVVSSIRDMGYLDSCELVVRNIIKNSTEGRLSYIVAQLCGPLEANGIELLQKDYRTNENSKGKNPE